MPVLNSMHRISVINKRKCKEVKLEVTEYLPDTNSKSPPLLFVHGAYHGSWCWKENFLPYFSSKGFPSYALSLRGHGGSAGREKIHSFSLSDYVNDVLETMLLLRNKPVLIGHSMGGAVVQKVLHLQPDKIKAVVLMASVPPNGMLKNSLWLYLTNFKEILQMSLSNDKKRKRNFIASKFFSKGLPPNKWDGFAQLLQQESNKALKDLNKQIVPKSIRANVPMLVLGSKKDCYFSERTTISIGNTYKTEPVIFSNISHDMMLDPEWKTAADQILTFLDESVF